jgi:beta propeller repeat protein
MKTTTLITLSLSLGLAPFASAELLTENEVEDSNPKISGNLIVWQSRVADPVVEPPQVAPVEAEVDVPVDPPVVVPADFEIMLSVDGVIRQITSNDADDTNPSISGNDIVWQSQEGGDWEIWAYNVTSDSVRQLTMNDLDDINPQIDNNRVVWEAWDGNDLEIGTELINLEPVAIEFKLTPTSLNLGSNGNWMTAEIKFADAGFSPADVDPSTIFLEGDIPAESVKVQSSSIKMKFSRSALQAKLAETSGSVEVSITAESFDLEDMLAGTTTIKVIPAKVKKQK